jgi:hypothetical protein
MSFPGELWFEQGYRREYALRVFILRVAPMKVLERWEICETPF